MRQLSISLFFIVALGTAQVLVLAGVLRVGPAYAQAAGQEAVDPGAEALMKSVVRIRDLHNDLQANEDALRQASGEEQESIMLSRQDKYQSLVNELREFAALSREYRQEGGDIQEVVKGFRSRLLRTGTDLRESMDGYLARLETNNRERDTQTTEGLKGYVLDSRQVDSGFSLLSEYVDVVESLEFEAAPTRSYLEAKLPERAEALAGRVRLSSERKQEYKQQLAVKKDDAEAQSKLVLVEQKLAQDTDSLKLTIQLAEKVGLSMNEYQTLLVKSTGQISSDMLDSDVIGELFHDWWLETKHSMRSNLVNVLLKVVVFLLILLMFRGVASLARRLIRRSMNSGRVNLSVLMQDMLMSLVSRLIMLMGVLVALAQVGVSLGPVLAGLGVAGFVIGFALQDTLGNFAAGMMILVYRPYDVGDMVEAAGAFGKVRSMNIVSTTILTIDNQTLIIPNSKIWGDVIKNVTAQGERRVDMVFGISYGDNIEKAERVLADIVHNHEKVLAEPEPVIRLHTLGESSVDFVVRPWARTEDYWQVYWDITRAVKLRFDAEGISIPFPQRDVHIYQQPPSA